MSTPGEAGKGAVTSDQPTLIEQLRQVHAEITESDGGESDLMAMVRKAADDLEDWETSFDAMWKANHRAIDLWRAAHPGNELVLPDQGKMIDWLCEEIEALRAQAGNAHSPGAPG